MALIRRAYIAICKRRERKGLAFLQYIEQELQGETFDKVLESYLQELL